MSDTFSEGRPSRLSGNLQMMVASLLAASFVSGILVWWGQTLQARDLQTPFWLRAAVLVHGGLYPFLCGLFGYLCCHHIRTGWELKANRGTGLMMEVIFATLILSGAALLYVGSAEWRERLVWLHRVSGLLLPLSLMGHWLGARRWVKKNF
jgi:hypothetical protein